MSLDLTVCLLHWRRPEQLNKILDALAEQRPRPKVFLWSNTLEDIPNHEVIDWLCVSNKNVTFAPRWWMASKADTKYVCSLDDDLMPADNKVFADLVDYMARRGIGTPGHYPTLVGMSGLHWMNDLYYEHQPRVQNVKRDTNVELLIGRMIATATRTVQVQYLDTFSGEDDIRFSGTVKRAGHLVVPAILKDRFKELPTGEESYWKQPGHFTRRHEAAERFFR